MNNQQLMHLITSPSSWEQVIYDVIAAEGLDPWDLDLVKLSTGFVNYVEGLKEMDFKIPAKYLMVASTLLRMKSDHLPLLTYFQEEDPGVEENGSMIEMTEDPTFDPLTIPPRRMPHRRIVVDELITALRKVMGTQSRRQVRLQEAKEKIKIHQEDLGKRISALYDRITGILNKVEKEEVTFSEIVPEWKRSHVVETFLPLVFLDHQKKVNCRQDEVFEEIYVKKHVQEPHPPEPVPVRKKKKKLRKK